MRRKSTDKNSFENVTKSKDQLQFDQICKELDCLWTKIEICESAQKTRIILLKDKH